MFSKVRTIHLAVNDVEAATKDYADREAEGLGFSQK